MYFTVFNSNEGRLKKRLLFAKERESIAFSKTSEKYVFFTRRKTL